MKKRLLTFDDLYNVFQKYTRSKYFNCEEQGCEPIVVQTPATIKFAKSEIYEGLTEVRLQACHTERNLNSSSISKEVMETRLLPTFKNRPILGYIHEVDGEPHFYGHNMHIDPNNKDSIIYDEIPVGIIPESNEASLEYDEETNKYNVFVSGYIFDEYTKATDILEREQELAVSVEISIKQMSYSPKDSCLNIEDGYFSGVTILGVDERGKEVKPGMAGSNIKLKDFSQSNNSLFVNQAEETNQKLIETLEKLNETLAKININKAEFSADENSQKGGNSKVTKFEELLQKYNKTETEIEFEVEGLSDEELEAKFEEVFGEESNDDPVSEEGEAEGSGEQFDEGEADNTATSEEGTVEDENTDVTNGEDTNEGNFDDNGDDNGESANADDTNTDEDETPEVQTENSVEEKKNYSKTFELSHDDIRSGLYALLCPYEEADNEYYWIMEVFESYFVYQGMSGKVFGQKYAIENEAVSFDGERYELFLEYLTASEKVELESMRSNYSVIETELNSYKEAELCAKREEVFSDEAYADFIEDARFVEIKENINSYSVEELREKCDLAFAACVKAKGNFALNHEEKPKAPAMFAYARVEQKSSFLDGLLKK